MKNKIKKAVLLFISAVMMFSFAGCRKTEEKNKDTVLTSFYPIYLISSRITEGTDIKIKNMARPQTGCLHDYQLTSLDMRLLSSAKLLIINGAGMEHSFIEKAVSDTHISVIDSSEGIFDENGENKFHLNEEHEEHDHETEHDHEEEHDHGTNSHLWMSVSMAEIQAENILKGLVEYYPKDEKILTENTENFINELEKLRSEEDINSKEEFNVISFNEAFHYLIEENGGNITDEIEIDENQTPTAKDMVNMTENARNKNVKAIFTADDSGKIFAETIGREINVPVYVLDPMTYTVSSDDYLSAMEKNIEIISEAKSK